MSVHQTKIINLAWPQRGNNANQAGHGPCNITNKVIFDRYETGANPGLNGAIGNVIKGHRKPFFECLQATTLA